MTEKKMLIVKQVLASAALATASIIVMQLLLGAFGYAEVIGKMSGLIGTAAAVTLTIVWFPFVKKRLK